MKTHCILLFIQICFPFGEMWGQKPIEINNPSFEADSPAANKVPSGWVNLGAADQTPPDIQPGFFQVNIPAQDGDAYLGLVVRENNTWEGVGQNLSDSMKKDSSYLFSLWLTRSNSYRSRTSLSTEPVTFNAPTILKIWGYNTKTKQEELLAESQSVGHSKWLRYEFVLRPTVADFDELDLMVYYASGHEKQNGNLLIDNCSAIVKTEK